MPDLRSKLIKLAHDVPELRVHLVPLLRRDVRLSFLKLALKQEAFKQIMARGGKLGVLSAYGGDAKRSKKENQQRHGQLIADLQKMGYHKWENIKGSWGGVAEKTLLVPGMKSEDLFELGKKYGQDSVIYKSEKGIVGMYYPKDKKVELAVDPKADPAYSMAKDKSEYSKTRNWSFSFDFLWGKDIPWDGHSVVSHNDVKKHLGIGKEKGESLDKKHSPGEVWKTDAGNWRALNNQGNAESFKDKGEADQYAH